MEKELWKDKEKIYLNDNFNEVIWISKEKDFDEDLEIWRDLEDYEEFYEVSSLGRVKSKPREAKGPNGTVRPLKPKIIKQGKNNRGYHKIELYKDGIKKTVLVHRLVALTFIPNPENKEQINHIDGNKSHNYIENLEWNTQSENMKHSFDTKLREPSPVTEEQKRKMAEGRKRSNKIGSPKKVAQLDKDTEEVINVFNSIAEASRYINCNPSSIKDVLNPNKPYVKICKGYKWKKI